MSTRLSVSSQVAIALMGRDLFSRYSYDDGHDYSKEPEYMAGVAWSGPSLSAEVDVVRSYGTWSRLSLGAETAYLFSYVSLRGGIAFLSGGDSRSIPAFGVSVRASRLTLHYGAAIDEEEAFGNTHRVSLAVRI
jgi:hypothetical protein